jgi:hypothetical protein
MRLIDVESARHPPDGDYSGTASGSAEAATAPAKAPTALSLHAIAKFLDALLQVVFVAKPEILSPPLRAADADRFGWPFGPCSIHGQAGDVPAVLSPGRTIRASREPISSARKRRKCVFHGQALKTAAGCGQRREGVVRLLLLTGSQNQFGVNFARGIFRVKHYFLRENCKSHELNAHDVSSARQSRKTELAF